MDKRSNSGFSHRLNVMATDGDGNRASYNIGQVLKSGTPHSGRDPITGNYANTIVSKQFGDRIALGGDSGSALHTDQASVNVFSLNWASKLPGVEITINGQPFSSNQS